MGNGGDGESGPFPDAVILLAGGAGRRLGGADKASLLVGGRTLLDRALATAAGRPVIVVGPPREVPAGVTLTREDPPGGGPAAGLAAGMAALLERLRQPARIDDAPAPDDALVAVLAVDQPGVDSGTLARLAEAVPEDGRGGAVLVHAGHRQHTVGVYPVGALARAVRQRADWHGVALRTLIGPVIAVEVPAQSAEADDVDTPEDLARWQGAGRPPG